VLLLISVRSVPFWLVFIPGLAGVHPVVSCSFMMVFWLVAAQPLLCMVSALSNTLSCDIVWVFLLWFLLLRWWRFVVWLGLCFGFCLCLVGMCS